MVKKKNKNITLPINLTATSNFLKYMKIPSLKLWQQVIIGLVLGVVSGMIFGEKAAFLKIFGTIFLSLIKMVVIPLMLFVILYGITSMGGKGNATRIGIKGISSYLLTATFAAVIGLAIGTIFQPGAGVDLESMIKTIDAKAPTVIAKGVSAQSVTDFFLNIIPTNPIQAMATDSFLQVVFFAIFIGASINAVGSKAAIIKEVIDAGAQVMFRAIEFIIKLAPLAVFGFMASLVGSVGIGVLHTLGKLMVIILLACILQYLVFGIIILVFGRISPIPFYRKMLVTQSIAFSTCASKAALPVAMKELQERMGVSKTMANFMMPLGVSINMDGVALKLAIYALFFVQAYGIDTNFHTYLILLFSCTLASVGVGGIPGGSIIFIGMVLSSIGIPLDGIVVILAVDRLMDMLTTTINTTGDATITLVVDSSEGTLDKKTYYAKN
jgi:Na+/H+-dicarboxylate symporter